MGGGGDNSYSLSLICKFVLTKDLTQMQIHAKATFSIVVEYKLPKVTLECPLNEIEISNKITGTEIKYLFGCGCEWE